MKSFQLLLVVLFLGLPLHISHAIDGEWESKGITPGEYDASVHRIIEVGDNIGYRVLEDRDDEIILTVGPSGELYIPYYGPVTAVGQTPKQLAEEIQLLLEEELYQKATVILNVQVATNSQQMGTVFLSGRINRIGPVQIDPGKDNTVAKIILAAGGFSDFADSSNVRIVRRDPVTREIINIEVDVESIIEDGELDNDVKVKDGDFVIVPQRLINW